MQAHGLALHKLPPQHIEAEQCVLGAILLENDALLKALEALRPEHFYRDAHRKIFEAILALFERSEPIDLVTLTEVLRKRNQLEDVGGVTYLATMLEAVPTAANVRHHARMVHETAILRGLINAATEIIAESYEHTEDVEELLDRAERLIFDISEKRVNAAFANLKDVLKESIRYTEQLYERRELITGVPSGFHDFDQLTCGLQPSELIIIAGRPGMGKCLAADSEIVLADGSIATIGELYRRRQAQLLTLGAAWTFDFTQPSAFVDDGLKPVLRVATRLGRAVESTLSHPFLTRDGWRPLAELTLGDKIAVPRRIDVFGAKRLRDGQVKLLAYFMGDGCLTVWGKGAHDKTIPPIVFQLTRSQMALFLNRLFGTDGWVALSENPHIGYATLSEHLARQLQHLLLRFGIIARLRKRLVKDQDAHCVCWQLTITHADSIRTFASEIGIVAQEETLAIALQLLAKERHQTNRDLIPIGMWEMLAQAKGGETWHSLAQRAGIKGYSNSHVGRRALTRERVLALATAVDNESLQEIATSDVYWDEIVSIEPVGVKQVYDLTIPETHNFVANDICVHNTAFALNISRNVGVKARGPREAVAIFSLEMSKEQLALRLLCAEARIDSSRLRRGYLDKSEWGRLVNAANDLSEAPIFIDDSPALTVLDIRAKARRLQAEHGLSLIIIDYLQLIRGRGRVESRQQEISEISRSLKALAKELKVPVVALSQLSRAVEQRSDRRPQLADLRESGALEQDSDLIAFIYRDEIYNKDTKDKGIAEVIVGKQRNGPIDTVKLAFLKEYARFEDLATRRDPF